MTEQDIHTLLPAALRALRNEGEQVSEVGGVFFINGLHQSPRQVVEYARELRQISFSRPLSPHAGQRGRPRRNQT